MPKRRIVDHLKLIEMVESGVKKRDIMKKFGLESVSQLKVAYGNALMQSNRAPEIRKRRGLRKKRGMDKAVIVGKRGSIVIPPDMVFAYGIGKEDRFTVRKSKSGIVLKKIS
jgi:hypothetical protein